jgi:molybdate transport system substrate-binding protein
MSEIKVFSAGAVEGPLEVLIHEFERESGHTVKVTFNTVGAIQSKLKAGEKPDLAVLSAPAIEALAQAGLVDAASRADLGRAETGLAVRESAASPDISTLSAFKQTLLRLRSVAVTDPQAGGSSGIYMARLFQDMGIAAEMKKKSVLKTGGRQVAEAIASGEAEAGITFLSEVLPIKGTKAVGPLPKEIAFTNIYAAVLPANGGAAEGARALIAFLSRPASRARFQAAGLEPPDVSRKGDKPLHGSSADLPTEDDIVREHLGWRGEKPEDPSKPPPEGNTRPERWGILPADGEKKER